MLARLRAMTGGRSLFRVTADDGETPPDGAPLGGTRAEAAQRLQVGLFGLGSMVVLIGLASAIGSQADRTQESAVPEAAPTTEPTEVVPQRDPLADAGIVPDIPAEPSPTPSEGAGAPTPAAQGGTTGGTPNGPPQR